MRFIKKQVIKESVEEVKEELSQEVLTEAVSKDRSYDYSDVAQTVARVLENHGYKIVDDLDTKTNLESKIINFDDIEEEFSWINSSGLEIQSDEVDSAIEKLAKYFKLLPEEIKAIEDAINKSQNNPAAERKFEYEDDLRTLEDVLNEKLSSSKMKQELSEFIHKHKHNNYTGLEKD